MPPQGRPTLLNDERQDRILQALAAGASRKDAAAYAGVSYSSIRKWIQRGRECAERNAERLDTTDASELDVLDDPDWHYFAFAAAVEESEARATIQALGTVAGAIRDGDWKAAAWYLRYAATRSGLDPDLLPDDETLRDEGYAIVEEIRRREQVPVDG